MSKLESIDMVVAGGVGERLFPLTRDRTKPAVPFGGWYRIIDLVLNNLVNSGGIEIIVAIQYKPASLKRHIKAAWKPIFERESDEFISTVAPAHGEEYRGNADAVYQNKILFEEGPRLVSVFGADHIYLMDVSLMKEFHLDNGAALTIAATQKPLDEARRFGVLVIDSKGEVVDFREKPENPAPMPGSETHCLVSMGNYVFSRDELLGELNANAKKIYTKYMAGKDPNHYTSNDFGGDIIPAMLRAGKKIMAYDYRNNRIEGIRPDMWRYWRDIGTLDQYYEANMDLAGDNPALVLANPQWPIVTHDESGGKPTHFHGDVLYSIVANGGTIGGVSENSIVGYNVEIGSNSYVVHSILMGNIRVGKNVIIRNAVIDKGVIHRPVVIPDGVQIGLNREHDKKMGFTISLEGKCVVVPRNYEFK